MEKTKEAILQDYYSKCGKFEVSVDTNEDGRLESHIYTQRFHSYSIYTHENKYENYSNNLKELYQLTFNDPVVMEKYATGEVRTQEFYENLINLQSLRVSKNYPFHAFIVCDIESDVVIGYEVLGNSGIDNVSEVAYLFRRDYCRNNEKKYVGYENVGALIWCYGERLYNEQKHFVNMNYDNQTKQFIDGSIFKSILATSRTDNLASEKILRNLGFKETRIIEKFEHERFEFKLDYSTF